MRRLLAPLRGVTLRAFRTTFANEIREADFSEAVTPFITATPGYDPLRDRELKARREGDDEELPLTVQFLTKDPVALRSCLKRIKGAGYDNADLNAGCPFPMVRNKGRGSGLLRTPDVLRALLDVGCEVMGDRHFSLKTRLGVTRPDELLELMPLINGYPLRYLTIHARTARQMYGGACDRAAFAALATSTSLPLVYNGDLPVSTNGTDALLAGCHQMIGRAFVRSLGTRANACERLRDYIEASACELRGERPVLGRIKELVAYWQDIPFWRTRWSLIKMSRTLDELKVSCR